MPSKMRYSDFRLVELRFITPSDRRSSDEVVDDPVVQATARRLFAGYSTLLALDDETFKEHVRRMLGREPSEAETEHIREQIADRLIRGGPTAEHTLCVKRVMK